MCLFLLDSTVNYHTGMEFNFTFALCCAQGKEAAFLRAGSRCHGERRVFLHSAGEIEPPGRAGAEALRGVRKDQQIHWKLPRASAAPAPVPQHVSHSALLRVGTAVLATFCLVVFFHALTPNLPSGAPFSAGRLTNQLKASSNGENVKLSVLGSAWTEFM